MDFQDKIFVAGHRGLLGSAVVRALKREGFDNIVKRDRTLLDLTDQKETLDFFLSERPDIVFLCAGRVGGILANISYPAEFFYENLAMTMNVIHSAYRSQVKKLVFVSSSCVYPTTARQPLKESYLLSGRCEPTNEGYALAKIAGIKMCDYYRKQYGCNFISAIPANLFGIKDHYDLERCHLLPALIKKIHDAKIEGRDIVTLLGTGKPRREFMCSDDCADALLFLMRHYSSEGPINIGTEKDATVLELAQTVARVLGAKVSFSFDTSKPDGMLRKKMDVTRLTELGWRSKISLEEGIRIAYEDFLKTTSDGPFSSPVAKRNTVEQRV